MNIIIIIIIYINTKHILFGYHHRNCITFVWLCIATIITIIIWHQQILTEKLAFKSQAASKVGSLNNVKHKAGGGDKRIFDDKDYLKQMSGTSSPCKTPSSRASSGRCSGAQVSYYDSSISYDCQIIYISFSNYSYNCRVKFFLLKKEVLKYLWLNIFSQWFWVETQSNQITFINKVL